MGTVCYKILEKDKGTTQAKLKPFNVNRVGSPVVKIMSDIYVTSQFEVNIPGRKDVGPISACLN